MSAQIITALRKRADVCGYGETPSADPASLACDYNGMYRAHWCRNSGSWSEAAQSALDAAGSVAELRAAWEPLEAAARVDGFGGGEYHHALAHLRHKLYPELQRAQEERS